MKMIEVISPLDGAKITEIATQSPAQVDEIIAQISNSTWAALGLENRAQLLRKFADAIEADAENLTQIIHIDGGKTPKEAAGEVANFVSTTRTNCDKALAKKLDDLGVMLRQKIYHPVGVVGLITSYNFPLAVAGWTLAPALLAGNAVVWKPSEKTPLVALAVEKIFNAVVAQPILRVINGGAQTGRALVESSKIGMISATGSVTMAQAILKNYNKPVPPILEAGGNNAVIISQNNSPENLQFALQSVMSSFLAGGGQKCTNTRRLFVHSAIYTEFVGNLKIAIQKFIAAGMVEYGYAPLIDEAAYKNFESAKAGEVSFGARILADKFPHAYHVEPALAELPTQSKIMFEECFAPLLYIVKYSDFSAAVKAVNAPENAGLVNGIYTQSRAEADEFAAKNEAGHAVINSATGTGTPAHGMGFGGNKLSGIGEILNGEDQLRPFTRGANRVAVNAQIELK